MKVGESKQIAITVRVEAQPNRTFGAVASCTIANEVFEAKATNTAGEAGHALAQAVASMLQAINSRYHKFVDLGPDVVLKRSARGLAVELAELLEHPDPPYASLPYQPRRLELPPRRPPPRQSFDEAEREAHERRSAALDALDEHDDDTEADQ
jgi:hypothetical protein